MRWWSGGSGRTYTVVGDMNWLITDKGDQDVRRLIDGESVNGLPHYSRQTVGARQFARNGQNLVFVTPDNLAAWITFRPTPGKAVRMDGLDCWENALFRNEGPVLSSVLIREAVLLSIALWGPLPSNGLITYIKPGATKSGIIGYCYRRAGWRHVGNAKDGKPLLRAPRPSIFCFRTCWQWKDGRGGRLREFLDG